MSDDHPDTPVMHSCRRCDGIMFEGHAMQDQLEGSADFIGDTGSEIGCTMTRSGKVKLVPVWKCSACGYSVTR